MPSPWRDNEVPDDVKKALKAVINKLCQRESDAKYKSKRKGKKKSKKAPRAEEPAAEVPVADLHAKCDELRQRLKLHADLHAKCDELMQYCAELKAENSELQSAFYKVAAALRAERAQWARERREWNELMQEFFGNGQTPKYNGLNVYGDFGSR